MIPPSGEIANIQVVPPKPLVIEEINQYTPKVESQKSPSSLQSMLFPTKKPDDSSRKLMKSATFDISEKKDSNTLLLALAPDKVDSNINLALQALKSPSIKGERMEIVYERGDSTSRSTSRKPFAPESNKSSEVKLEKTQLKTDISLSNLNEQIKRKDTKDDFNDELVKLLKQNRDEVKTQYQIEEMKVKNNEGELDEFLELEKQVIAEGSIWS